MNWHKNCILFLEDFMLEKIKQFYAKTGLPLGFIAKLIGISEPAIKKYYYEDREPKNKAICNNIDKLDDLITEKGLLIPDEFLPIVIKKCKKVT